MGLKGSEIDYSLAGAFLLLCGCLEGICHLILLQVQMEVTAPFASPSTPIVCCCARPLCQTYAVMFSQFREVAVRVARELAEECALAHGHVEGKVDLTLLKRQLKVSSLACYD